MQDSPNWDKSTKIFITACTFILLGIAVWQFQSVIYTLIIAGMIAYLLNLPIVQLQRLIPMNRASAVGLVYSAFALIVMALLVATGVTVYQQSLELLGFVQKIAQNGPGQYLQKPMQFGVWLVDPKVLNLDLDELTQQALIVVQGIVSSMAQYAGTFAQMAIGWFGSALIIFVLSIYFAIDLPRFGSIMSEAVHQPGYRRDAEQLLTETGRIWNAYLRGQTTLAVIVGIIVSIGLTVLGVNNALALGLLAGILDFIPFLGPAVVIGLSTLVALFQGSNWLGLNSFFYALIVLVFGIIVQQIEGNWLNPRIMGGALGLHPLLIVVGAIMGSTIAGILGVILAAPVMATTKLLGTYIWRKMFDLKPFPENVEHETLKRET